MCQYYAMTLWTLITVAFFREVYSKSTDIAAAKVVFTNVLIDEKPAAVLFSKEQAAGAGENYTRVGIEDLNRMQLSRETQIAYLQLVNEKVVKSAQNLNLNLKRGKNSNQQEQLLGLDKDKVYICLSHDLADNLAFSHVATQLVQVTGLDVLVFATPPPAATQQESGSIIKVLEARKPSGKHILIKI